MSRPYLLDLFCGQGGAAAGYIAAGWHVIGVDLADHSKRYPGEFHQGDALAFLATNGAAVDAIHASPPCQGYSIATAGNPSARAKHRVHRPAARRPPGPGGRMTTLTFDIPKSPWLSLNDRLHWRADAALRGNSHRPWRRRRGVLRREGLRLPERVRPASRLHGLLPPVPRLRSRVLAVRAPGHADRRKAVAPQGGDGMSSGYVLEARRAMEARLRLWGGAA